jgi:NAD(P)-dependent dehydrogenase (short-subunit alcohol dehydrogenase family)
MSTRSIHQFAEKVALVTDGTNPVGMAVALQLALNGSYVVVGKPNGATASIAELESLGTLAMSVDWETNETGAKALVNAVREKFGRLDLLVNCLKPELSGPDETAGIIDLHLKSVCYLTDHAVSLMVERPKPRIVNIVSACDSESRNAVFAATQAGIVGFTKALAQDLPDHFRVNAVSVSEKQAAASGFDPELARPQLLVSPDDAARTVLFLLSGESASINGQVTALR